MVTKEQAELMPVVTEAHRRLTSPSGHGVMPVLRVPETGVGARAVGRPSLRVYNLRACKE